MASCGKLHFVYCSCRASISFTPLRFPVLHVYKFLSGNVTSVLFVKRENNDTTKLITKIKLHWNTTCFPWNVPECTWAVQTEVQKSLKHDNARWAGAADFRYSGAWNGVVRWEVPWHFKWMWIKTHLTHDTTWIHIQTMTKCQMKPDRWTLHKQCTVICLLDFVLFLSKQAYKTKCLEAEGDRIPSTIHVIWQKLFFKNCQFYHWNTLWNTTWWE